MEDFKDRVVLITSAGRGVGARLALAFARQGAVIAANDLTPMHLDRTLAAVTAQGGQVKGYQEDIVRGMPVEMLVDEVMQEWGRLDAVIHVAATRPRASLLELDEWDWHRALDSNLTAGFLLIRHASAAMRQSGGGVFLLAVEDEAEEQTASLAAYEAAAAGCAALAQAAAGELGQAGLRINALLPVALARRLGYAGPGMGGGTAEDLALALCAPGGPSGQMMVYGRASESTEGK